MENKETKENGVHIQNPEQDDNSDSNLQNGEEIITTDDEKLRGDAIGNTVYSERYVLETLIKLKDNAWNKELEDDMCCIWDMTLDKDVVDFLLNNNFIELSINIIKQSKELRLIEILVGIVGNMCTHQVAAEKTIESSDFDVLLSLVFSDDAPTLIQLMRLFKALLFCKNIDCKSIITTDVLNQINFILNNAKNTELLGYTLQITGAISDKNKRIFLEIGFLKSISEAFREILDKHGKIDIEDELKYLSSYLKIIENACTLINDENQSITDSFSSSCVTENVLIMQIYLDQFANENFMLYESQNLEYFIYCFINFLISFETKPNNEIFNSFIELYYKINEKDLKDTFETDVFEYITNYLMYFVENKDGNQLKDVLKNRSKTEIKKLFVEDIINKYDCTEKFKNIVHELCT